MQTGAAQSALESAHRRARAQSALSGPGVSGSDLHNLFSVTAPSVVGGEEIA